MTSPPKWLPSKLPLQLPRSKWLYPGRAARDPVCSGNTVDSVLLYRLLDAIDRIERVTHGNTQIQTHTAQAVR